jgi:hypothetical protein
VRDRGVVQVRHEHLVDGQRQVGPGQVGLLQRAYGAQPGTEALPHHEIDRLGAAHPGRDQRDRLPLQRVLQPVPDEPGHVAVDGDGGHAQFAEGRQHARRDLGVGPLRAHHLDQAHQRGWVPEVQAQRAGRIRQVARQLADRDRRGVAGEDGTMRREPLGVREDAPFEVRVLRHRLDHQVGGTDGVREPLVRRHRPGAGRQRDVVRAVQLLEPPRE